MTATPCQSGDPDRFFARYGREKRLSPDVKAECRGCHMLAACLSYALAHRVEGIWAGTDEYERAAMRRRAGIVAAPIVTAPQRHKGAAA